MLPNNGGWCPYPDWDIDTLETASDLVKVGYIRIFTTFRKKT